MTRPLWIPISLLLLTASSLSLAGQPDGQVTPGNRLAGLIDHFAKQGRITQAEAANLRHLVVDLKQGPSLHSPTLPNGVVSHTQTLMLAKKWMAAQGVQVLPAPPPSVGHIDSATLPIRVFYETASHQDMAQLVLTATEGAWNAQVTTVGYPAPYTGDESTTVQPGLWVYVADSGMGGGGYTEPLRDVPSTTTCDCSMRVVIDRANPDDYAVTTAVHEFNHSTQGATDCGEAISAWEGFATAVENHYNPDWYTLHYFMQVFQDLPEKPLDYWVYYDGTNEEAFYQYGEALFPFFLMDRYDNGNIEILRDAWYSFAQPGTWNWMNCSNGNTPNWFQGLDSMLQLRGSSLNQAIDEFGEWRSVVGNYDDGHHFLNNKGAHFPEVNEAAAHTLSTLPATGQFFVHEYGSRHILLTPGGYTGPLHVEVTIDPAATWAASVLLWRQGQAVEKVVATFAATTGVVDIPSIAGVHRAMLVVTQHSDATHNPDNQEYSTKRNFSYVISDVAPEPIPEPMPEPVPEAGPDTQVIDAGQDVAIDSPKDSATTVDVYHPVDASADAQTEDPQVIESDDDGGCGCRTTPSAPSRLWWLSLVALALAGARRLSSRTPSTNRR